MKILIGVDDSDHSKAAVEYVKNMRWPEGSKVLIVSAVREVIPAYSEVYAPAAPYSEQIMDDLFKYHQETASAAERALRGAGLTTEVKVLPGDPRTVLVDTAR